eukprot:scaffold246_cov414-Prasinococcus_capsulatus_cf.AAC.18
MLYLQSVRTAPSPASARWPSSFPAMSPIVPCQWPDVGVESLSVGWPRAGSEAFCSGQRKICPGCPR